MRSFLSLMFRAQLLAALITDICQHLVDAHSTLIWFWCQKAGFISAVANVASMVTQSGVAIVIRACSDLILVNEYLQVQFTSQNISPTVIFVFARILSHPKVGLYLNCWMMMMS